MNTLQISLQTSLELFSQAKYTNPLAAEFDKVKAETHKIFTLDKLNDYLHSIGVSKALVAVSWVGGGMVDSDVKVSKITASELLAGASEDGVQSSIEDLLVEVRDAMNVCAHARKNLFNVVYDRLYDRSQYSSALTALIHTKDKRSRTVSFSLDTKEKDFLTLAKTVLEDEDTKLFSTTFYNNLHSLVEKNLLEQMNIGNISHLEESGQIFKI